MAKGWGFVGPSYASQSPNVDAEDLRNWYVELVESPFGKSKAALYPTPGFAIFATLPQVPIRGMLTQNARTFAVGGIGAYEISSSGAVTALGSMVQDPNPATLNTNGPAGHQNFITSGGRAYIYDLVSGVFTDVTATIGAAANLGAYLDGYFLALDTSTATLYTSALENGLAWSGAAQRNTSGDKWVSMFVSHRDLWLFGSQRTDVWQSTAASFPFAPIQGAFIEQGIAAPFSVAELDNAPVWLGASEQGTGVVWRANGYSPQRISNHAVEYAMQGYSTVSDAVGFTYQDQGHSFYNLNFPTAGETWVYDAATGLWHKRGPWSPSLRVYAANRAQYHAFGFNQHLVGDRLSGGIYTQAIGNTHEMDGALIRRLRRAPYLTAEQNWVFYDNLQIDLEVGLGLSSGQGTDPQCMLRWSNNQAKTWSNEHWQTAGLRGQYGTRAFWNRLGRGRNRVFELAVSDPIPWRVTDAIVSATPGFN